MGTGQKFFNDFSELVWISIYAKSLKSLANLAETVQTDPGSRPLIWAVERGQGIPWTCPQGPTHGIEKHWHVCPANGSRIDGARYSNAKWSEMAWADGASDD